MPTFSQKVVPGLPTDVPVQRFKADSCLALLERLGLSSHTGTGDPLLVALSFRLTQSGFIEAIALATDTTVFQITVTNDVSHNDLASVLNHPNCLFVAFDMARAALLLHRQFGVHIRGVDLTTLPCNATPGSKKQHPAVRLAHALLPKPVRNQGVCALFYRSTNKDLCLRAWLSACIASRSLSAIAQALKVDTRNLSVSQLVCVSQLVLNVELLDAGRPTRMENDFERVGVDKTGSAIVTNARFKSKVRESGQTIVHINGGKVKALAIGVEGKQTTLKLLGKGKLPGNVDKVCVVGREDPTNAELARDRFVLGVLQGVEVMDESSFVKMLWFPPPNKGKGVHRKKGKTSARVGEEPGMQINTILFQKLNPSQQAVVRAMIGEKEPLVIAHGADNISPAATRLTLLFYTPGPPGTGKTSTIAVALEYWEKHKAPAWVVAHSNIGVKNIAESLVKRDIDFKIIVSKDFYYEWSVCSLSSW
uniref:Adenylate cyclase n=1 Tax=Ganoderma boninense TaxID=34458 RepID=A0A5K1K1G1_9APHY|nr:Adenylate cyclase [Ganoderma boninense]